MEKAIKDIYNCSVLSDDDILVKWYNTVIEKTVEELSISDVARCIRQGMFVEVAYEALLSYLLYNPYEGDVYEGELMDKASEVDKSIVIKHKNTIIEILKKAFIFINENDWIFEEDKKEFIESVNKLAYIVSFKKFD